MGKVSKALNKAESPYISDTPSSPSSELQSNLNIESTAIDNRKVQEELKITPLPSPTEIQTSRWDERLVNANENFSGVSESFRKLRTKILYPETGDPAHSVMVLSSDPQEGKTFVCANLGISFAHSVEKHALMVDCDLRRPSLHGLFGVKRQKGLTNYLKDGDRISDLILATGLPKLSIIPAGSPTDNPSELLSSDKMFAMVKDLTARYNDRLILLDTPPFFAASETLVMSRLVDKVVLVVRWGKTGREKIKKMTDLIGREKIIGVVFNAFEMNILDRKVQGVGYHNYYSESYY